MRTPLPSQDLAVVLGALRSPFGARGGALAAWHPVDLAAELLDRVVRTAGASSSPIDEVVFGCASQVGAQACNIARRSALAAGWPEAIVGITVDCHASASALAVHLAVASVVSRSHALVIAGGVESMSAVPFGAPLAQPAIGKPYGTRLSARYTTKELPPPGLVAEEIARHYGFERGQLDDWAEASLAKARQSQSTPPAFIAPLEVFRPLPPEPGRPQLEPGGPAAAGQAERRGGGPTRALCSDEALGRSTPVPDLSRLRPVFLEGGSITAANMAAEGDGAAALLIARQAGAAELGLEAKAKVLAFASSGAPPSRWPLAVVPAAALALERAGLNARDVRRWYIYESSSAAVLACAAELRLDLDDVNVGGGALATTGPLGAVGAGLFAEAVSTLAQTPNGFAMVCTAGEGGVGTACLLGSPA